MSFRFSIILAGALLAKGRRTASSWFRATGVGDDWDRFYDALISIGKRTYTMALPLLRAIISRWGPGADGYWVLGIDDSPTARYGRHVEGADVHRNPTAGPAESDWIFGHNWVSVALLKCHTKWGTIALPILSELYVRQKNSAALKALGRPKSRTKLQLAADQMTWIVSALRGLGTQAKVLAVFDGAYAAAPLLQPLAKLNVTVVSRLRRDASLFDLPGPPVPGRRGRPRIYGKNRFSPAIWSNIGCWHLNQWLFTMVEMTCWDVPFEELTDRSGRPWDNPDRRPSHADRRRYIAQQMLEKTFFQLLLPAHTKAEKQTVLRHLLALAT